MVLALQHSNGYFQKTEFGQEMAAEPKTGVGYSASGTVTVPLQPEFNWQCFSLIQTISRSLE